MTDLFANDTIRLERSMKLSTPILCQSLSKWRDFAFKPDCAHIMFSLMTGPARAACNGLKIQSISLEEMIYEVRKQVLFDVEIKDS